MIIRAVALLAVALTQGAALAQEYPARPIRIVVPFTPSGATDLLARLLSQRFYEARTIKELIALSKTRREGLNFGSNGTGTTSHLAGVMLAQTAGLVLTHIPYKGASAAMTSLLGGEVDMGLPAVISGRPQIAAGKLRGLAVTTRVRSSVLPDLPTLDSIYPGFDIDNWFALFAPAGTPQAVVNRIHAEVVKGLQHADFKAFMAREGAEPVGSTPAEFAAFFKAEVEKYAKIVKLSGAKPDS